MYKYKIKDTYWCYRLGKQNILRAYAIVLTQTSWKHLKILVMLWIKLSGTYISKFDLGTYIVNYEVI